jgi:GAF domain-containing protein
MAAFNQRAPAAIGDIRTERDWDEISQVLLDEGVYAALSVPMELDGGVIGTLDVYAADPRGLGSGRGGRLADLRRVGGQPAVGGGDRPHQGRLADVARDVTVGQSLPVNRRHLPRARAEQANGHQTAI